MPLPKKEEQILKRVNLNVTELLQHAAALSGKIMCWNLYSIIPSLNSS